MNLLSDVRLLEGRSGEIVSRVVKKSMFWQEHRDVAMNERQVKGNEGSKNTNYILAEEQ